MKEDEHSSNLVFLTNRVGRQLLRIWTGRMEFDGFRPQGTHIGLLADLIRHDGQRQQDLAITGIKDKATVARSIVQLVEAGMVNRVTDTTDRRQKIITLTDKGRALWDHSQRIMNEVMDEVTDNIEPQRLAICKEVLFSIYEAQREETQYAQQTTNV